MKTTPVDSKHEDLDPAEILIIAAHQNKKQAEEYKKRSKKSDGVSAERLLHTIYVEELRNPSLVRLKEGNTLFTITPLPQRVGVVSVYNGDVEKNIPSNIVETFTAAQKLGFDFLIFTPDDIKPSFVDSAFAKYKEKDKKMTKKSQDGTAMIFVRLCKQRD